MGDRTQGFRIRSTHVRETYAKALLISAYKRILSLQVDVITNQDQSALLIFCVDPAGRICNDQPSNSHALEDAHRKCDLLCGVPFVKMHPTLHRSNRNFVDVTEDHLSGVTGGGRAREIRNRRVWSSNCFCEFVGKTAKPGTENETNFRA